MLEQTEYIPVLAFALQPACEHVIALLRRRHPRPATSSCTTTSSPAATRTTTSRRSVRCFVAGTLVAWSACKGHQADIGGAVRGGYNPEAREVWQEALRIPPVKVYERGRLRRDVWDLIFANIRLRIVEEDIRAQIGGTLVGERGLHGAGRPLRPRYDPGPCRLSLRQHRAHGAQGDRGDPRRHAIGGESLGVLRRRDAAARRMKINLTVTVSGSDVTFDFTGSSPQTPGFVNAPYSATASALLLTFLMLINPDIPHNAGLLRPLKIVNPEGSFLNARFPAATTFGNSITGPTSDAIFRAFAQAHPADGHRRMEPAARRCARRHRPAPQPPLRRYPFPRTEGRLGRDPRRRRLRPYRPDQLRRRAAGAGLRDVRDPGSARSHPPRIRGGFGRRRPLARWARRHHRIPHRRRRRDRRRVRRRRRRGGARFRHLRWPAGKPQRARHHRCGRPLAPAALEGDRTRHPPRIDGDAARGGGGGYGDPRERPVEDVLADVRNGLVSVARARDDYGVVVDPVSKEVDDMATRQLRENSA